MKEYKYNINKLLKKMDENRKNDKLRTERLITYADAILRFFMKHIPYKEGYAYRANALLANADTLKKLERHLPSFSYLAIAPTEDNNCPNNTIVLRYNKVSDVVEKC